VKAAEAVAFTAPRARLVDFVAITKPRLNVLVIATSAAGFYLASGAPIETAGLALTIAGTALVAGGASGINQVLERDVDARMERTCLRPLPDGRLQRGDALAFAAALSAAGLILLAATANVMAAAVALATLLTYAFVYTPLKRRTPLATVVGAVPGALPPLIGWAAVRGSLAPEAWTLFAIVFLWQMPHFLAIAWMYREDYARAGFPMLPVIEPDGLSTGRQAVLYAAVLVPASLMPTVVGLAGALYLWAALALGTLLFVLAVAFARTRSLAAARWLFLGSITYLPLAWAVMIADRVAH
jgi:protoheme IX farnesyltransferase